MKYVNRKTGQVSLGNRYLNGVNEPSTHTYNEETGEFDNDRWVEIDDQLISPMIILNKKGYTTKYCCAGHAHEGLLGSYVMFEEPIFKLVDLMFNREYALDKNLFDIEDNGKILRIKDRKELRKEFDILQAQSIMDKFCISLLQWTIKLPYREELSDVTIQEKELTKEDEIKAYGEALGEAK